MMSTNIPNTLNMSYRSMLMYRIVKCQFSFEALDFSVSLFIFLYFFTMYNKYTVLDVYTVFTPCLEEMTG